MFGEPERDDFFDAIQRAGKVLLSPVTIVETRMVVYGRRGQPGAALLGEFLDSPKFEIAPPSQLELDIAYSVFVKFGKGQRHPAKLNLGDLFSYALAKSRNLPLLYKGKDFAATDIASALA